MSEWAFLLIYAFIGAAHALAMTHKAELAGMEIAHRGWVFFWFASLWPFWLLYRLFR